MPNIDQVQLPNGSQYNLKDNISGYVTAGYVDDAIDALTKADVGLGNVDNTSDLNKPVSTAQQTALNGKTDTAVIAPTEATTTASRRYEIGEQFILNGVLYTATAVIASGDSIIVGTNCTASDTIVEQMADIQPDLSAVVPKTDVATVESGTTASKAYSVGELVYVDGALYKVITSIASGETFTVDTNIELTSISDEVKGYTILKTISSTTATSVSIPNTANEILVVLKNTSNIVYGSVILPKELFGNTITLKNPADLSKEVYKSGNNWRVTDAQYRGVIYYK